MKIHLIFVSLLLAGCGGEQVPANLDEALLAYRQNRVAEAEAAFARIASDPAAPAPDRARALRETARIAWKVDGDPGRALRTLQSAEATGEEACQNARLRARVLSESGQAVPLLRQAEALSARCTGTGGGDSIRLHAARAALEAGDCQAAQAQLAFVTEDSMTSLEGAAARLDAALLARNPAAALSAWNDYFWLEDEDLPPALQGRATPAGRAFAEGLADAAPLEAKLRLLDLLVKAGFATQARHFAAAQNVAAAAGNGGDWRRISTYLAVRKEIEGRIVADYRAQARGRGPGDLSKLMEEATGKLLSAAGGKAGDERERLAEAFNLYGYVGQTGGFPGVHYGHLVEDRRAAVSQYGRSADGAFRILDNMISNGFETWLWDGTAATGGWTEAGPIIIQVRPEWTAAPRQGWKLFSGGPERSELLAGQPKAAAADVASLKGSEAAYLPGLADRLRLQVADQIGTRARAQAPTGGDLRRAYLEEYWRAMLQDSMFTHEGRHAIDKRLLWWWQRLDDAELEFRAKAAQLALADYPRLALINIDDSTIGGDSAHGVANVRVMKAFAAWIAAHRGEVRGYDPRLPAMVQIDRLTDAQIRAIGRSLDPLAALN
jgi:hypothetical protein